MDPRPRSFPAIAHQDDGGFVVVWSGSRPRPDLSPEIRIYGRRFDPTGDALGDDFRVGSQESDTQLYPAIDFTPEGNFLVVWNDVGDAPEYESTVRAIMVKPDGSPAPPSFAASTDTASSHGPPSVAVADDGGFMVVWASYAQDNPRWGVFARKFDAAAAPVGGEIVVSTYTSESEVRAAVAALPAGGFVVTWDRYIQTTGGVIERFNRGVFGRLFDDDGNPRGQEFRVDRESIVGGDGARVAPLPHAGFVVVWNDFDVEDDYATTIVLGQRFTLAPVCGDANADEQETATDALLVLRGALGLETCEPCLCDGDASGSTTARDALRILSRTTDGDVDLNCPACP